MLFQNYPDNVVFLYSKTLNVKVDYELNPCLYRLARQGDDRDGAGAGTLPLQIQAQVQPRQDRHHDRPGRCLNLIIFGILTMNRTIQNFISRIGRNGVVEHLGTHTFL